MGVFSSLADFIGDFGSQQRGVVGPTQAAQYEAAGIPNARGLTLQQLQQILGEPSRQSQIAINRETVETAPFRRRKLEAEVAMDEARAKMFSSLIGKPKAGKDQAFDEAVGLLRGESGMILKATEPALYNTILGVVESKLGKPLDSISTDKTGKPAASTKFKTAEDVKAAVRAGKLDKNSALSILRKDFGFK